MSRRGIDQFDLARCLATHGQTDIGLWFVALWSPELHTAVGIVYGTLVDDPRSGERTFISHGSFVNPSLRRRGIRTKLNDVIFGNMPVDIIRSERGSAEGGEEFMRRTGYRRDELGNWFVRKETWEAIRGDR